MYKLVAKYRYRVFGEMEKCRVPTGGAQLPSARAERLPPTLALPRAGVAPVPPIFSFRRASALASLLPCADFRRRFIEYDGSDDEAADPISAGLK